MPITETIGMIGQGLGAVGQAAAMLGIGQRKQDKRQLNQQQKLTNQQIAAQKELGEHQKEQQLDIWNKTNYEAQVKHLEAAGLNPGLLYGHSGGGGATTGAGMATAVTGGQATDPSAAIQAQNGMAMTIANMRLIESQARKNNAEADKIAGVDTEKTSTEIKSLTQGIENQKQQEMLTKVQTRLTELQGDLTSGSMEDVLDRLHWEANKTMSEASTALTEAYVSNAIREEKINIIKQEAIYGVLKNVLTKAQTEKTHSDIKVNDQQIKNMSEKIMQDWHTVTQGDTKNAIEKFKAEVGANYPNLLNTVGRGFDDLIELIFSTKGGRTQYKKMQD